MSWGWLIIIVVTAVIILGNLMRRAEGDRRKAERSEQPPAPRPRQAPGDVDRFMEEIARRRRESARRPEPPRREPPRPPRPAPRRQPPALRPVVVAAPVPVLPVAVAVELPPTSPLTLPTTPQRRPAPARWSDLASLLRSPENLRTAILLREVLSPPLCRRRR